MLLLLLAVAVVVLAVAFVSSTTVVNQPMSPCMYGRIVGGYTTPPAASNSGVDTSYYDGTCHFSNAQPDLPSWYAAGYLAAPDDETYNGFPWTSRAISITTGGVGKSCGECFEIFGDVGKIVVMATDICDKGCCNNCQGSLGGPDGGPDIPNFDINSAVYNLVTKANGGGVPVAYRKVSCDMSSLTNGMGVMFGLANEGTVQATYFRMRVFGQAIGVANVEVQGSASGATGGNWVSLQEYWEGCWNWTGRGDIGAPFSVRVTSITGQVIVLPSQIQTSQMHANAKFYFGTNFDIPPIGYDGSTSCDCTWPGPTPNIYIDSLGGDSFNHWVDWGSYTSLLPNYTNTLNCVSGSCIAVNATGAWTAIQIGFSSGVGAYASYYSALQFDCFSATTAHFNVFWDYGSGPSVSNHTSVTTTTSYTTHTIPISNFWYSNSSQLQVLQFQFSAATASTVYFDNIMLIGLTKENVPIRVVSSALAGPPAVGFSGYTGPSTCCAAGINTSCPVESTGSESKSHSHTHQSHTKSHSHTHYSHSKSHSHSKSRSHTHQSRSKSHQSHSKSHPHTHSHTHHHPTQSHQPTHQTHSHSPKKHSHSGSTQSSTGSTNVASAVGGTIGAVAAVALIAAASYYVYQKKKNGGAFV